MRRVTKLLIRNHRKAMILVLVVAVIGMFSCAIPQTASAVGDQDNNSIIWGGKSTPPSFIAQVRANDSLNNHHDLKAIYAYYGLEPTDYDRFVVSARPGTAYKNNTIVVDGQVVATGVKSIGRLAGYQGSGYFQTPNIPGAGVFYGNTNDKAFATDGLPVMVMFNGQGVMEFAVIDSCGNPEYGYKVIPTYTCNSLHQAPVAGKPGTVSFTTSANFANNAKFDKLLYDFGDGHKQLAYDFKPVMHTYTASANYTAKVTVFVHLPGNQTVTISPPPCSVIVPIALPFYQCVQLAAAAIGNSKYQYNFIVTGKALNGAVITGANFSFGDGKSLSGVKPSSGSTVSITHTYAKDGMYATKATLLIWLPNRQTVTVTAPSCAKTIPVAVPYYNCVQLSRTIVDQAKASYTFTATANFGNGATFTSADFTFGDGTSATNVQPSGTSVTAPHMYAAQGNYTINATLHFKVGSAVKNDMCSATLTPTQFTPECKPGVAEGSPLCTPCQYNAQLPANSPQCVAGTTTLPNTGAGDVIGIFGAVAVVGFFFYRQFIYRKHAFAMPGMGGGAAMTAAHHHVPDADETSEKTSAHHSAIQHPLSHPSYHRPHRFRPRSHHDQQ